MLDTAPPPAQAPLTAALMSRAGAAAGRIRSSALLPLVVIWAGVIAYFAITEPRFLTGTNVTSLLEQNSVLFVVAVAQTVVLLTGAVDLSVGGLVALCGLVLTVGNHGVAPWLAVVLTILAGGVISAVVNGLPIGLGRMNPFVVTLGTASIFFGLANVLTNGDTQVIERPELINALVSDTVGPIPVAVLIMAAVLGAVAWMLRFSYFGRNVYAAGGNPQAATLAGISVGRVRVVAFGLLGLSAGLAAVLYAGQLSSVAPSYGVNLELQAIAAVLLGGTALMGGKGGVLGTAIAVLFLGTIQNGLDLSGVSSFWQSIVTGTVLVAAVGFDQARQRLVVHRKPKGQP